MGKRGGNLETYCRENIEETYILLNGFVIGMAGKEFGVEMLAVHLNCGGEKARNLLEKHPNVERSRMDGTRIVYKSTALPLSPTLEGLVEEATLEADRLGKEARADFFELGNRRGAARKRKGKVGGVVMRKF